MRLLKIICLIFGFLGCLECKKVKPIQLNEENWKMILKDEWMVAFMAPWCPACADLKKSWATFADASQDSTSNVAEVDVTQNPGLSGRFLVTTLPSIYHVKDGVFREYTGSRDSEDLVKFIKARKWTIIEPMSKWKNPDSIQMAVVAGFFRLSLTARDLHYYMIEKVGLPPWASYSVFGIATLFLGCFLGFLMVMFVDWFLPGAVKLSAKPPAQQPEKGKESKDGKKGEEKDVEIRNRDKKKSNEDQSNGTAVQDKVDSSNEKKKTK